MVCLSSSLNLKIDEEIQKKKGRERESTGKSEKFPIHMYKYIKKYKSGSKETSICLILAENNQNPVIKVLK